MPHLHQPGITDAVPAHGRYLQLQLRSRVDPRPSLQALALHPPPGGVVGLGSSLVSAVGGSVPGLREHMATSSHGVSVPSTPAALWLWLRGDDRGVLVKQGQHYLAQLQSAFVLHDVTDGFMYREGRDLTGYVDGTENPKDDKAIATAIIEGAGAGLDGGSLVAVERWHHDLNAFDALSDDNRDAIIGRRHSDDSEISDAPAWAHVKRTAQESFEPAAFVLRRSMPWADGRGEGLMFVAFGASLDPFDALLSRMIGRDDGIVDALYRFTRPVTGSTFFCPPTIGSRLDLRALGL